MKSTSSKDDASGWIIAVDGGGSKVAIAARSIPATPTVPISLEDARVWRHAGTGSAHPGSWSAAQKHLALAMNHAAAELAKSGQPIHHVLFALAGAGRREDADRVVAWARELASLRGCPSIYCVGDIEPLIDYRRAEASGMATGRCESGRFENGSAEASRCAGDERQLDTGQDPQPSLAVILGTGSIVAARGADGSIVRAGGWGPNLGDDCSGGALGVAALRAVTGWFDSGAALETASPLVTEIVDSLSEGLPEVVSEDVPGHGHTGSSDQSNSLQGRATGNGLKRQLDRQTLAARLISTAADRTTAARLAGRLIRLALVDRDLKAVGLLGDQLERLAWQIEQVCGRSWRAGRRFEIIFGGGLAEHHLELRQAIAQACQARGLPLAASTVADPLLAALRFATFRHNNRSPAASP